MGNFNRILLFVVSFSALGCNSFNKLMDGPKNHRDPYDNTPVSVTIDGITSFDYDVVYNVPAFQMIRLQRPQDSAYFTINIYEYQYDAVAKAVHFGKAVAIDNQNNVTVLNTPIAPIGTKYQIVVQ